jgi:hypothetical protein
LEENRKFIRLLLLLKKQSVGKSKANCGVEIVRKEEEKSTL